MRTNKSLNCPAQIVFSKINLKRNLNGYFFEQLLSQNKKEKMETEVIDYLKNLTFKILVFDLDQIDENEKKLFIEDNIIDSQFYNKKNGKFVYLPDKNISIVLNNDDHLNFSAIKNDFNIENQFDNIYEIEKKIGLNFSYSANTKYGYLTSYIKDCGLALKLSTLIFLPGLCLNKNKLDETIKIFIERGYSIEPWVFLDENDKINYFLFSSRLNFGVSEKDLLERFVIGINQLLDIENKTLKEYYLKNNVQLDDIIYRSYGLLRYSRIMEYKEAIEHLSNVRIGLALNHDLNIKAETLNIIMNKIKTGNINIFAKEHNINNSASISKVIRSYFNGEQNDVS